MNQNEETICQTLEVQNGIDTPVVINEEEITLIDGHDADKIGYAITDNPDDIEESIEFTYDTPDPMDGIYITSNDSEAYTSDDLFSI